MGRSTILPAVWNVPNENPHFVGREEILALVDQACKASPHKTAVLTGPQGFGKTQIAKRFVYKNFAQYDVVWWFWANQYLKPQFARFAQAVAYHLRLDKDLKGTLSQDHWIHWVKEALRRSRLKCLIIFDDAQTYPEIEDYIVFSHDKNIHTLITTKNGHFSSETIPVRPFRRENSLKYITSFLPHEPEVFKKELAQRLGDCPAALALSIEYIKSYPGMTIQKYLFKHAQQKSLMPQGTGKKLGSSVDEYEKDLTTAIKMNMQELEKESTEALALLGLLSLLHRDKIPLSFIESWAEDQKLKTDIMTLIRQIQHYSLVEVHKTPKNEETYLTMQELIQTTLASQLPSQIKQTLICQAAATLKKSFTDESDKNVAMILTDNTPLLNVLKLSREAEDLSYHHPDLTQLRIRCLDVLVGMIRDFPAAEELLKHLDHDLHQGVPLTLTDQVLYYANLSLYAAIRSPDYEKAIDWGLKALKLVKEAPDLKHEHLRILANLSQYHSLRGLSAQAADYIEQGESLFKRASSDAYKALFVLAKNIVLNDQARFQETIDQVRHYQDLLDRQTFYPSMRYFILNQWAEALLKKGEEEEAKKVLATAERYGREVHGENNHNMFFGRLYVLQGMALASPPADFEKAKRLMDKGIAILDSCFQGKDKHRLQAFAHWQQGKLWHQQQQFTEAKTEYLKSEAIYDKILKGKKIDDISALYACLVKLGADTRDESLTQTYLKKHIATFGLDHPRTQEVMLYLDQKGLVVGG